MGTPDTLPEGCPPQGHKPSAGVFYRLTRGNLVPGDVPGPEDWVLPLHTKKSEAYQQSSRCDAYSYSLFAALETLMRARESIPFVRKKSISRVMLDVEMGWTLETPSAVGEGHHDWWPSAEDVVVPAEVIEAKAA